MTSPAGGGGTACASVALPLASIQPRFTASTPPPEVTSGVTTQKPLRPSSGRLRTSTSREASYLPVAVTGSQRCGSPTVDVAAPAVITESTGTGAWSACVVTSSLL